MPVLSTAESRSPSQAFKMPVVSSLEPRPHSPQASSAAVVAKQPSHRRKRRLSESDTSDSPHLAKRLHLGPRLHAVSDSFPQLYASKSTDAAPHIGTVGSPAMLSFDLPPPPPVDCDTTFNVDLSEDLDACKWHTSCSETSVLKRLTDYNQSLLSDSNDNSLYRDTSPSTNTDDLDDFLQSLFCTDDIFPACPTSINAEVSYDTPTTCQGSPCSTSSRSSASPSPGPSTPATPRDWPFDITTGSLPGQASSELCKTTCADSPFHDIFVDTSFNIATTSSNDVLNIELPLLDGIEGLGGLSSGWRSLFDFLEAPIKPVDILPPPSSPLLSASPSSCLALGSLEPYPVSTS